MFKTTGSTPELDLFSTPGNLLGKRGSKKYDDPRAWHNQFFKLVTSRIDEKIFHPLFKSGNMGAPNASIRVLVSMSILKKGFGCSDEALPEKCEYDLLARKALGLLQLSDTVPSLDTYCLFRRRICDCDQKHGENLMEQCFKQAVGEQVQQFRISGKCIRMDSKLIGSNIAWYSRYETVHSTPVKFFCGTGVLERLNPSLRRKVEAILAEDAQKTVYRSDSECMNRQMDRLGEIIYQVLVRIKADSSNLLHRVFHEQYTVDKGRVSARDKSEISAGSVQNPNDPEARYRNKNGQKVKGYSTGITETLDESGKPNLITDVQVKPVSASDNDFLQDAVIASASVTSQPVERVYVDGACQSEPNREFADRHDMALITGGIQGGASRFELEMDEQGLTVTDRKTGERIRAVKTGDRWRIATGKGKSRYFCRERIEKEKLRKSLASIPIEERNKRNNVEATIFQYCFHTRNNKTRYRGLMKHKLYSCARCLWINCIRLVIYQAKTGGNDCLAILMTLWMLGKRMTNEKINSLFVKIQILIELYKGMNRLMDYRKLKIATF
jgi:hypothetical protein